jgi:hypothetical protein
MTKGLATPALAPRSFWAELRVALNDYIRPVALLAPASAMFIWVNGNRIGLWLTAFLGFITCTYLTVSSRRRRRQAKESIGIRLIPIFTTFTIAALWSVVVYSAFPPIVVRMTDQEVWSRVLNSSPKTIKQNRITYEVRTEKASEPLTLHYGVYDPKTGAEVGFGGIGLMMAGYGDPSTGSIWLSPSTPMTVNGITIPEVYIPIKGSPNPKGIVVDVIPVQINGFWEFTLPR